MKERPYALRIEKKIREALNPSAFELIDDSNAHAGHGGAHPSGETHFTLHVTSSAFNGLSRVDQQRLVYKLLEQEMAERVHALSLKLKPFA
ncbi:MAG: BolA family transcriptional regulator [Alphaproteobacteria bacterium]|nr:BolA family transcriptional regulator [Alphaproteobacteria bacterium]